MSVFPILRTFALGCLLSSCLVRDPATPSAAPHAAAAAPTPSAPGHAFVWPHGTRAAVSLTYDDAIQSQIDTAAPALAKHGLPATFFLSGSSAYLQAHPEAYRALVAAGHELGSHTMFHPCDRAQSWVKPGFALQDYSPARMKQEIADNVKQLTDLGQKPPFTFAYPCGSTWIGEAQTSYIPLIQESFIAARGVNSAVADPSTVSLFEVPSPGGDHSGPELIEWVDRALGSGGWVVFLFHGVAGDYLSVQADAHEALLSYLDAHRVSVWTERFGTVAQYVATQRGHN